MAAMKRFSIRRKRVCKFCAEKITFIDYKDGKLLSHFIPERGKILLGESAASARFTAAARRGDQTLPAPGDHSVRR